MTAAPNVSPTLVVPALLSLIAGQRMCEGGPAPVASVPVPVAVKSIRSDLYELVRTVVCIRTQLGRNLHGLHSGMADGADSYTY